MPSIGRSRPSSPSSPRCTTRSTDSVESSPAAARQAIAIARSNPDPCFGSAAGDRLTVRRRDGSGQPGVDRGGAHTVARLAEGGIGQADDDEGGQLRRQVGLDLDDRAGEPEQGDRAGAGDGHQLIPSRCSMSAGASAGTSTATASMRMRAAEASLDSHHAMASRRSRASLIGRDRLERMPVVAVRARLHLDEDEARRRLGRRCRSHRAGIASCARARPCPVPSRWSTASCSPRRPSSALCAMCHLREQRRGGTSGDRRAAASPCRTGDRHAVVEDESAEGATRRARALSAARTRAWRALRR